MAAHDSFDIPNLNLNGSIPMSSATRSDRNPEAAAAARARLAALHGDSPTATPTAPIPVANVELVTDRQTLAEHLQKPTQRRVVPSAMQPLLTAAGTFALLLLAFKAPVIINQIHYETAAPQVVSTLPVAGSVIPAENTINIPKINVHAPLVNVPSRNEADVQKGLENGVIHYSDTPNPGEGGNAVYFGHSSNDWWEPGNYKFVFVLLDKLAVGDKFTIDYNSVRYTYEVTGSKVVEPNDLSVLNPTAEPTVTIITCTPPGTSWKRLVVSAKQIDPAPTSATPKPTASSSSAMDLPTGTPGILTQVGHAMSGVYHGVLSLFGADNQPAQPTTSSDGTTTLPGVK